MKSLRIKLTLCTVFTIINAVYCVFSLVDGIVDDIGVWNIFDTILSLTISIFVAVCFSMFLYKSNKSQPINLTFFLAVVCCTCIVDTISTFIAIFTIPDLIYVTRINPTINQPINNNSYTVPDQNKPYGGYPSVYDIKDEINTENHQDDECTSKSNKEVNNQIDMDKLTEKLKILNEMKTNNLVTDEEYEELKEKLLNQYIKKN